MIDIIIPTLRQGSPVLERCLESIRKNTRVPYVIHLVSDGGTGTSYAEKINLTYPKLTNKFFFLGADDLVFHPDWDTQALEMAGKGFSVIGTNDMHNPDVIAGNHATHYLVRRQYIKIYGGTIDGSYPVLYNYRHNYCDNEFVETAKSRGVWRPCFKSIVEHLHWSTGLAPMDDVYRIGLESNDADLATYNSRKHLWNPPDTSANQ